MSTPGSTDNPGQMLPIRMMAKCTDGGPLDGKWVDLACTSSGQLQSSNSSADARVLAVMSAFPAGSLTLAQGKVIAAQTIPAVFAEYSAPFIVELVNVIDKTHTALDLDVYVDTSTAYEDWVGTVSEGNYAYAGAISGSNGVVGLCKIRSTDYTTQYSAASTAATSIASKALVMSGSANSASTGLNIVVVSAGTSTATLTAGQLQIELVIRTKPSVSVIV